MLSDLKEEYIGSSFYLLSLTFLRVSSISYFCCFIRNNTQKIHRRYTEDTQIVLFEYNVGIAQTQTKAICKKIRKADLPMKWVLDLLGESWINKRAMGRIAKRENGSSSPFEITTLYTLVKLQSFNSSELKINETKELNMK